MNDRFLPGSILVSSALLAILAGCGGGGGSTAKYVPQESQAKEAIIVALDAWKNAQIPDPAGKLASGVTVKAVDMDWSGGQKLVSYEIGPEIVGEQNGPRKISVKLGYAGGLSVEATYFVVGIDPLQVFRDKDYEKYFGTGK
ncbi:MAG: hypothetical protein ACR2FY_01815 [Pirellulaceae bacterium]